MTNPAASATANRVADFTIGLRRFAGADWPVQNVVYREGKGKWIVVYALCAGVPSSSTTHRTLREARRAMMGLL
jgi:hypothetical protein